MFGGSEVPATSVEVLQAQTLGKFDVIVLRAKDRGLSQWLTDNSLQGLDRASRGTVDAVDDYIAPAGVSWWPA